MSGVVLVNLVCDLGMTGGPGDQGAGGGRCFARLRRTLVGEPVVVLHRSSVAGWIAFRGAIPAVPVRLAGRGWGSGGAVVAGRAGRLLSGALAVGFWDGGGPAGQELERVFGGGTGLGGVEGQHEAGLGWEVHRVVGNFDHADDRVAEALDPGVVQR